MISVNDCISLIIKYVDVMIDNADAYCHQSSLGIYRQIKSSNYQLPAYINIRNIDKATIDCIDIIDRHKNHKLFYDEGIVYM